MLSFLFSISEDILIALLIIPSYYLIIRQILNKKLFKNKQSKILSSIFSAIINYFIPWIIFLIIPIFLKIINIKLEIFDIIALYFLIRGFFFLLAILTNKKHFNFFIIFFILSAIYYKILLLAPETTKIGTLKLDFIFFSLNIDTLIQSILIGISYYSLSIASYKIIELILMNSKIEENDSALIKKIIRYWLYCIGVVILYNIFHFSTQKITIITGALGVGIGFGLQKIASNFISGFIVAFDKQIKIGDLIEFENGIIGYIKDIHIRCTIIENFNLEKIIIPNESFINEKFKNITYSSKKGKIRLYLIINHDQDIEKVINILENSIKRNIPPHLYFQINCRVDEILENGFKLQSSFILEDIFNGPPKDIWQTKSDIIIDIQKEFRKNNIEFAWPKMQIKNFN